MKKILAALLFAFTIPAQAAPRQVPAGYVDYTMTDAVTASAQTGHVNCYAKTDGRRYCRDASGTERKVPYSGEIGNADVTPSAGIAYSKLNLADSIVNADINSAAAIVDTKLATISSAGKVANTATTATSSAGTNTIVMRNANGDFVADKIQHEEELLVKQISTPSNPSAGYVSIYTKSDDKVYKKTSAGVESEIGSGGGGGSGINLITFDTSGNNYAQTKQDNFNVDALVGDWLAYADAAGTEPVDMTGGSPGTTCTRTTSSPLNGTGSLLMDLGSGSSRQGEGCSVLVNVPPAYRGKNVAFTFPFSITGTNVENDFKLYAYDVTNSLLITPFQKGRVLGTNGQAIAVFGIPTASAQIRVGVHVARTSTAALSLVGDDFQVSPQVPAIGLNGANTQRFNMQIDAATPPTVPPAAVNEAEWWQSGDRVFVRWKMYHSDGSGGNNGSGTYYFNLPAGMEFDPSYTVSTSGGWPVSSSLPTFGTMSFDSGGGQVQDISAYAYDPKRFYLVYGSGGATSIGSAAALFTRSTGVSFEVTISFKAKGKSANITSAESSTFWISSYLAGGTRVTSAPTKLGEYRTQLRNGNASTFSDSNGAPTYTPSTSGFRLYNGNGFGTGDTNNEPTAYDIFVGKGKSKAELFCWTGTDRATPVDVSGKPYGDSGGSYSTGYVTVYNSKDGYVQIRPQYGATTHTAHYSGLLYTTTTSDDPYCDILVSENALAVGADIYSDTGWITRTVKYSGSSSCTLEASDFATSCSYSSNIWTMNFPSTVFASAPICSASNKTTGTQLYVVSAFNETTTSVQTRSMTINGGSTSVNATDGSSVVVTCRGPRYVN